MFYGAVRDLMDVRHVPQMKKNIISVRAVKSKELKVTLENEFSRSRKGHWL